MAVTLHADGFYYGYFDYLTEEQMQVNAKYITAYFRAKGWSDNAIAGMLGNFQPESRMNPALWEGRTDHRANGTKNKGFSLAQWTPWAKYTTWCEAKGLPEYHMDSACYRVWCEFEDLAQIKGYGDGQYYSTDAFPVSRSEFIHSDKDPGYLAKVFVRNYERPASVLYDEENETMEEHLAAQAATYEERAKNAVKWYEFITGTDIPDIPDNPDDPTPTPGKSSDFLHLLLYKRRGYRVV